ncbi:MAG: undecaprenyl-diphosphatase 2 [bacterium]|nr:MAG: undecaprenyl-diphosphatase 2 [bacterium]
MTFAESAVLGIMQGLTEFLPVSSSGHLVLMQAFLGLTDPMVFFDVLLHVGTLAAIVLVYRKDIWTIVRQSIMAVAARGKNLNELPGAWFLLMIIAGSVPAGVIGILFENLFEELFASTFSVGFFLLITGVLLFSSRKAGTGVKTDAAISVKDALLIGFAQAMAITPGISRSGATIAIALLLGVKRESAAKYSFLLSIPAIAGATLLKSRSATVTLDEIPVFVVGMAVAFGVGAAALLWLIKLVKKGKLEYFAWYCWAVGSSVIAYRLYVMLGGNA